MRGIGAIVVAVGLVGCAQGPEVREATTAECENGGVVVDGKVACSGRDGIDGEHGLDGRAGVDGTDGFVAVSRTHCSYSTVGGYASTRFSNGSVITECFIWHDGALAATHNTMFFSGDAVGSESEACLVGDVFIFEFTGASTSPRVSVEGIGSVALSDCETVVY